MSKAAEDVSLRNSGIEQVGCIPWGTHLCQFYESKQDLVEILVPYFAEGLLNNEFCLWITAHPLEVEEAKNELAKKIPDLDYFLRSEQIEIFAYNDWYLNGSKFDSNLVLKRWVEKEAKALKRGFEGLRLTGNTSWVDRKHWQSFLNHEEEVNSIIHQHRMIALCTYCLADCEGNDVVDVILNHDGTLFKRENTWSLIEDIFHRRKTEQELMLREQKYHSLFSNMMDGFAYHKIVVDDEGKPIDYVFVEVNDAFEKLTGLNRNDILGKCVTEVIPGIDRDPADWIGTYGKVALTRKPARFENYAQGLDKWYLVSAFSLEKGYFAAIFEDITKRKKAEKDLSESLSREHFLADLIRKASVAVGVGYPDGKLGMVNTAFQELTGYTEQELKGRQWNTVLTPPEWLEQEDSKLRELKNTGKPVRYEKEYIRKDGHRVPIELVVHPFFNKCGKVSHYFAFINDITERKKGEKALWQANTDWEDTFDTIPDFIAILDSQHKIVRTNQAFAKQLGISPEQAIGKACYSCVHGTSLPPEFCPHTKTLQDGNEHLAEVHEPRLGGDFIVSTTPLRDENGRITGSVHVARNITDRKLAEDALKKLNRHLRAISNSNQALMHAKNEQEYTQEVCDVIVKDCGYALVWVGFAEHDEKKTVKPIAFAGNDKDYIDNLKITWDQKSERGRGPTGTVIRTGKPYVCRKMIKDANFAPWRKKALEKGYTASLVLPLISNTGETFGALNIYSKEISPFTDEETKLLSELANDFAYGITMLRIQRERRQAEEKLDKQAALIDLSPDAIIVRKLDGNISFWSRGAEKLYGWIKEETVGNNINSILQTEFSEPLKSIIEKLKKEGHWSGELIHQTKDGFKVTVQSYWLAKFDEKGQVLELMESNVDITGLKQMQNKLEEYAAHLEELVQERTQQLKDAERLTAIGETAGMVGHDLRNPLQTVTGETYLAKEELKQLPQSIMKKNLEENIQIISEQISYMDKIVSDLQDFVRPIKPEKQQVDINKLIKNTLNEVAIPESIKVSNRLQSDLPEIAADKQLLKRVLFNLFTNGIQAMPNGGKLTIKTKIKRGVRENRIQIQVEDNGVGIPEHIKPKIFRPLFTTKSKGQGFGLAVCRRVIEAHGGNITFRSNKGEGTQFITELPIANKSEQSQTDIF